MPKEFNINQCTLSELLQEGNRRINPFGDSVGLPPESYDEDQMKLVLGFVYPWLFEENNGAIRDDHWTELVEELTVLGRKFNYFDELGFAQY